MKFTEFKPAISDLKLLPSNEGVYLITANSLAALPIEMRELEYQTLNENPIIYVGIASNLKNREYKNHFHGTSRNSTLRKSIGSLFNLRREQYPGEVGTAKYRFIDEDEQLLSRWMIENLTLLYHIISDSNRFEDDLIRKYQPPLNLRKNNSKSNLEFRKLLSEKRKYCV